MVLFFSDLHIGRDDSNTDTDVQTALLNCVAHMQQTTDDPAGLEAVHLVGDVFDAYIEYRRPRKTGGEHLFEGLARLVRSGVEVVYLKGNHDPWHRDFITRTYGIPILDSVARDFGGLSTFVSHGDEVYYTSAFKRWVRESLRHPVPVWLYRNLIPPSIGLGLAHAYSNAFGDKEPNPVSCDAMRELSLRRFETEDWDLIVHGHSHREEMATASGGCYINLGYWRRGRTFAVVSQGTAQLARWTGERAETIGNFEPGIGSHTSSPSLPQRRRPDGTGVPV